MTPQYMTVEAFTERFALSRSTLYRLLGSGQLRGIRVGKRLLLPVAEVEAYFAAQPVARINCYAPIAQLRVAVSRQAA
jgi:excisionase family DNA binding protein